MRDEPRTANPRRATPEKVARLNASFGVKTGLFGCGMAALFHIYPWGLCVFLPVYAVAAALTVAGVAVALTALPKSPRLAFLALLLNLLPWVYAVADLQRDDGRWQELGSMKEVCRPIAS